MKVKKDHSFFMQKALMQARVALKRKEVPVGAVVVDANGNILGRGYNRIESAGCQAAHAEVIAIQKACKKRGDWRLDGCWLYVTLEPCLMCFGLIQLSRLKGVVYGATSPLFGAKLKKLEKYELYKKNLVITAGLKEKESIDILREFFKNVRKKKGERSEAKGRCFRKN